MTVEDDSEKAHSFLRKNILQETARLKDHITGKQVLRVSPGIPVSARPVLVSKLQQWSAASSSRVLWIVGPPDANLPSNMSFAALSIVSTASQLGVPLLFHLCALPPYKSREDDTREPIGLAYSLVRQLIQQMPPDIHDTGLDLSASRLQKLNGSIDSGNESLRLLRDLLDRFPAPLLLCGIDGLGRLDSQRGSPFCADLLKILMDKCAASGTTFKLLLTTSGKPSGPNAAFRRVIPKDQQHHETQHLGKHGRHTGGFPLNVSRQLSESFGDLDIVTGRSGPA